MLQIKNELNLFDKFTNLYSLSKTLRFELKPTPETEELLKKTNLQGKTPVQVDQEIDELYYKQMKPLFDTLHETFITEALGNFKFDIRQLKNLEKNYLELKRLIKEKKNNASEIKKLTDSNTGRIPTLEKELREVIVEQFNKFGEEWKTKYRHIKLDDKGYKILTNAKILQVLLILHPEKNAFIKKFERFFTYFSGFNQNKENYYTTEAKTTGVGNRVINVNLPIFLDNKQKFEEIFEKVLTLKDFKKYFELDSYKYYLTQKDIDDFNENIIGKINSEKNLFCQQENTKPNNKNSKIYLPNLNKLQKQIGCKTKQQREQERKGASEYLEKVGLDFHISKNQKEEYQIWEALNYVTKKLGPKLKKLRENYKNFFNNWQEYKLDEIWFRKGSLNTISGRWFGGDNWSILTETLAYLGTGKMEKGEYKIPPFVSLQDLNNAMETLETEQIKKFSYKAENLFKEDYKSYFKTGLFETLLAVWQSEVDYKFKQIFNDYEDEEGKTVKAFLKNFEEKSKKTFDKNKKDSAGRSIHTEVVKNLIEKGYLRLFQLTKYHNLEKKGKVDVRATENRFYDVLNEFWEENPIVTYHKAFQATLTKKPYSENKIKLNFECGTLLGGWSPNYESYGALIFQKNEKFYLGIIKGTKFNANEVNTLYNNINLENKAERLLYVAQKIDNKNPPRWFIRSKDISFSPMVREGLLDPKGILDIYDKKLYSKTDNKKNYKNYLPKLLDYFKEGFRKHKDFKEFKFDWSDSKNYDNIADFYNHTADMCYKLSWENINIEALIKLVEQKRIYLFQIYNKDLELDENIGKNKYGDSFISEKTIGKLNSHTQILLELLKPENVRKLKLLGGGELFFRDQSKEKKYKKDKERKEVLDAKRYYEPKYFLHFPIILKGRNLKGSFNQKVNLTIVDNQDDIRVIGIDRGEKNLLYFSVINSDGKMIDKGSLNVINNVDYNAKLQAKQDERNQARLDWEQIGNIKNFKEGYLSQVVNKIYELIIRHNAIIAMEDLNSEFKAKRAAKVEKSVYKKFELALARKLNHLILKDKKPDELGGVLNGYQLTPYIDAGKIGDFEKAKQWGILFYVRANYTSTTDPLTGWRKHKYISNSETDNKIKEFFSPDIGIQIKYDQNKKCFKFSYENEGKSWKLLAFDGLQRFYWNNKKREIEIHDLHKKFEELFKRLDKLENVNKQIYDKNFNWRTLVFYWNLLNQIRNNDKKKTGNDNDFLQSPVWSARYECFYDSRKVINRQTPDNGDANGAYNIARKGLILVKKIKKHSKDDPEFKRNLNLFISDQEWDEAVSDWSSYVAKRA